MQRRHADPPTKAASEAQACCEAVLQHVDGGVVSGASCAGPGRVRAHFNNWGSWGVRGCSGAEGSGRVGDHDERRVHTGGSPSDSGSATATEVSASLRICRTGSALHSLPDYLRDRLINGAGVRLLLGDTELGQHVDDGVRGLTSSSPGQLVDSNFTDKYRQLRIALRLIGIRSSLHGIKILFLDPRVRYRNIPGFRPFRIGRVPPILVPIRCSPDASSATNSRWHPRSSHLRSRPVRLAPAGSQTAP